MIAWVEDPSLRLPAKAAAFAVDDGDRSVYDALLPIATRERLPATLFVYPSAISKAPYALTRDRLRSLAATGLFDIQSHAHWPRTSRCQLRYRGSARMTMLPWHSCAHRSTARSPRH